MDRVSVTVRVFFGDPFWIAVVERVSGDRLWAAKVTFGPEPREFEVYEFLQRNYYRLKFSPAVEAAVREEKAQINPKRMQRKVRRQMEKTGLGTKSQQALKEQHEQLKTERRQSNRREREAEALQRFEQKRQKRKEKHRGR